MKNPKNAPKFNPKSDVLVRPAVERHFIEFLSIRNILIFFGAIEVILIIFLLTQINDINSMLVQRHLAKKDWTGAKPLLEKVYAKSPSDWVSGYQMAIVYAHTNEPEKALKCLNDLKDHFTHVTRDDIYLPEYYALLGKVNLALGRMDEASSSTRQALVLDPQLPSANSVMGQIYMKQNDLVRAGNYMKYLATDPEYKKDLKAFTKQTQKMLEVPDSELSDVPEQVAVKATPVTNAGAASDVGASGTARTTVTR